MLTSLSLIFICALIAGAVFEKIRLPKLIGLILTGVVLGPYCLNMIDVNILNISADIRKGALIIILIRAGLSLDISDLKRVGRPAVLMCFLPACFEICAIVVLAPMLLGVSIVEAAIMGTVIAAVSPAVVVPRMVKLIEEGYGKEHSIPQLILAGASVDDIFVIVLFTSFTGIEKGDAVSLVSFLNIPISIVTGVILGVIAGYLLDRFFVKVRNRDTIKIIIILSISFVFVGIEDILEGRVAVSSLLAVMAMGITLLKCNKKVANRLSVRFNKLWVAAEIMLFVLVGAAVNITYVKSAGIYVVVLICLSLIFRMVGVMCCLIKTDLVPSERLFCMLAYTPKATVQAAIGSIPLTMGLDCGEIVLTAAVCAIIITAPFGAIAIDSTYRKLLK